MATDVSFYDMQNWFRAFKEVQSKAPAAYLTIQANEELPERILSTSIYNTCISLVVEDTDYFFTKEDVSSAVITDETVSVDTPYNNYTVKFNLK